MLIAWITVYLWKKIFIRCLRALWDWFPHQAYTHWLFVDLAKSWKGAYCNYAAYSLERPSCRAHDALKCCHLRQLTRFWNRAKWYCTACLCKEIRQGTAAYAWHAYSRHPTKHLYLFIICIFNLALHWVVLQSNGNVCEWIMSWRKKPIQYILYTITITVL